jgi:hypothetical protein
MAILRYNPIDPQISALLAQKQHSLRGLGADTLDAEIDGFLLRAPNPSSSEVADFLKLYAAGGQRDSVAKALIASGVSATTVSNALAFLNASANWNWKKIGGVAAIASAIASGFHGYRRNHSIAWGAAWFVLGGIFPIFTPVIAVAQGYGKRKAS